TFNIEAEDGYHIENVIVDGFSQGSINTYTFAPITSDGHTLSAVFKRNASLIRARALPVTHGTIEPSGDVLVETNRDQTFTITPEAGYSITNVKVDGVSVGKVASYTFNNVTEDHTIDAYFSCVIVANAGANGSIEPSGSVEVDYGSSQTFIITPNRGYHILDVIVDGLSVGAVNSYTFSNVIDNHSISVTFEINTYDILASADVGGNILPAGVIKVTHGSSASFTVKPDPGYEITNVIVDNVSKGAINSYKFENVETVHTISTFFRKIYIITASAGPGGMVSPGGSSIVGAGGSKTYTISPDPGFQIADVKIDDVSMGVMSSYTFSNVNANHTIYASFGKGLLTIESKAEEGGSISPAGIMTVNYGETRGYIITPNPGYRVADVLVNGASVGAVTNYVFTNITANYTILAKFALKTYSITATADPNGNIEPSGILKVNHGSDQVFNIIPNLGYTISNVFIDGMPVGPVSSYVFESVNSDHTIRAIFEMETFTITAMSDPHGKINPSGQVKVKGGNDQTFEISSDPWYVVEDVHVDGKSVGVIYTYTFSKVSSDHVIHVKIRDSKFIKGDVNGNGTVTVNDAIIILLMVAGVITPTESQIKAGDVNNDGKIGADDALIIFMSLNQAAPPDRHFIANNNNIELMLGEAHGVAGETIMVPVKANNMAVLGGGEVCISYDDTVLKAIEVSSVSDTLIVGNVSESGKINIAFIRSKKPSNDIIANIKFEVLSDKTSTIAINNANLYRTDAKPINYRFTNGNFRSWLMAPDKSALLQNFPNPFNPETWIPFQLKDESDVVIKIYSLSGELVRELNLGHKPAGIYTTKDRAAYWDGKDRFGIPVSSGIYFYSISAGKLSDTKKMIVLR
ncbi:MAG: InlB B-repeat-containing protein, partial [bacterium]